MVKLYNNVVRTRVKGYGAISHLPVVFRENDFGQLKGQLLKMNPKFSFNIKKLNGEFFRKVKDSIMEGIYENPIP